MTLEVLSQQPIFFYVFIPLLIFFARVIDVTIGTIRIVFVSKGHKLLAAILGFFEVFIWVIVIGQVMQNVHAFHYYVAYAGGFAAGNYVGLSIEERLAVGNQLIRVITKQSGLELIKNLNAAGFGATLITAKGATGKVNVIYSVVKRSNVRKALTVIEEFNPQAFYSIEDVRRLSAGVFPVREKPFRGTNKRFSVFKRWRKGK